MDSVLDGSLAVSGLLAGLLLLVSALKASEPRLEAALQRGASEQKNAA